MPIYGFVGPLGSGKTHMMVKRGLERAYRRNAVVVSFIKITPGPNSGIEFRQISLNDYGIDERELLGEIKRAKAMGKGVVVLLDEVGILLPAREIRAMSRRLMFAFSQSRKMGVDVFWTAQNSGQVDAFLRRLTESVIKTRCWPRPTLERFEQGKRPLLFFMSEWPPDDVGKRNARMGWSIERYDRVVEERYDTLALVEPPEDALEDEDYRRATRRASRRKVLTTIPPEGGLDDGSHGPARGVNGMVPNDVARKSGGRSHPDSRSVSMHDPVDAPGWTVLRPSVDGQEGL